MMHQRRKDISRISPSDDIRSVTDLKRNTREILDHLHAAGRPVILTVNGRADSVLLDVKVYEKHLRAGNLARLIAPAEKDAKRGVSVAGHGDTEGVRDMTTHWKGQR